MQTIRGTALVAALVASTATAAADPVDTVRSTPVKTIRGQLERFVAPLALLATASETSLRDLLVEKLAGTPEGALLLAMLSSNTPKAYVVDLAVGAGGGTSDKVGIGEVTASLGVRIAGDFCDILSLGLTVRGSGSTAGESVAGETRANGGFCFWRGLYGEAGPGDEDWAAAALFPLRMTGDLALNATPRFSGLRNQPRRRYSEAKYSFAVEGLRFMPYEASRGITFIYLAAEQRWEWAGDFTGGHGFELYAGFGFLRFFHTRAADALADRAIDVIDIRLHGTRFDEEVAIIDLYPLKLRGISLGSDQVLLDAEIGVTGSGGTISSSDCIDNVGCVDEMITTGDNVAKVTTWAAQLGLSIGRRDLGGGFHFGRRLDSNVLGQLAVESRGTAWYQMVRGPLVARGELFGGTALHYLDVDARGRERFAGGSLDASYFVGRWWLGVQVDAIAAFARDPVLEDRVAGSGVRAFATLGWRTELARQKLALPQLPSLVPEVSSPPPDSDPATPPPVVDEPPLAPPGETAPLP